jgi:hypothetical protein
VREKAEKSVSNIFSPSFGSEHDNDSFSFSSFHPSASCNRDVSLWNENRFSRLTLFRFRLRSMSGKDESLARHAKAVNLTLINSFGSGIKKKSLRNVHNIQLAVPLTFRFPSLSPKSLRDLHSQFVGDPVIDIPPAKN